MAKENAFHILPEVVFETSLPFFFARRASASLLVLSCKEYDFCISSTCSLLPKFPVKNFRVQHWEQTGGG